LTKQIEELVPNWSMAPVVEAFQAIRGVAFVAAVNGINNRIKEILIGALPLFARNNSARRVLGHLHGHSAPTRPFEARLCHF